MVRATKTTTTDKPMASATHVVASTEKVEKKVKAEKKVKTEKVVAPVDETLPVVPVAPLAEGAELIDVSSLASKLTEFGAKVQQVFAFANALKNEYKTLEKTVARELKSALKASKKKRTSGNRTPSGFIKPTLISDELAVFLEKPKGSELARTAVSKEINAYIRANSLQDPANGRQIHPDAKLAKLLKLAKEDELTYFNLQRYMKHHFIKTVPAVASVASA